MLADMMRSGSYGAHLPASGRLQRRAATPARRARCYFGLVEVSGEAGGLHVFWQLAARRAGRGDGRGPARRLRVGVYALASGGAHDAHDTAFSRRGLILGYAALTPKQIEQGMSRLADVIDRPLGDAAQDQRCAGAARFRARRRRRESPPSGSRQSSAAGSTRAGANSGRFAASTEPADHRRDARRHPHLSLPDQGTERAAGVARRARGRPAVSRRPRACPRAAEHAD